VIEELRSIQHQFGYLPADRLQELAAKIHIPLSQIHAVASFYPHFHLTPPAQAEARVCADMSCHLRGAPILKRGLEQAFRAGGPERVAVRNVSCLGRCDQAPALSINDQIYCNVDEGRALSLVQDVLSGRAFPSEKHEQQRATIFSDPYNGDPNYSLIRRFVENRTGRVSSQP
jgi:NADH:ubiquinone oxidoreductase subunit E